MFRSRSFAPAAGLASALLASPAASASINMDWVTVGNAGNAPDPTTGYGAVGYEYRIGAYEVTNAQYATFLNAVAASDPNGLYGPNMGGETSGGITRSGSDGSYTYAVRPDMGDKPVNYVSWYDAARFANWMTNGQGSGGTESGVYTFTGPTTISAITRDPSNPNQIVLPSEDEWYKAAYHQPASQGGDADDYWLYATQSNTAPTIATATGTGDIANPGPNVANYDSGAGWNGLNNNVTTVGSAGPGSASFYGTFDMNGNVWEMNETLTGASRGLRGGARNSAESTLRSSQSSTFTPTFQTNSIGFRVANPIPGPGPAALFAVSGLVAARRRR